MKCEKQRHQGEENSSNVKRGTGVSRPHTPGCWGSRSKRGCDQPGGSARPGPLSLPHSGDSPAGALSSPGPGQQLLIMPPIHSFTHSFVPLTNHVSSTEGLSALMNVYPGNYSASRDPGREDPLAQPASPFLPAPPRPGHKATLRTPTGGGQPHPGTDHTVS